MKNSVRVAALAAALAACGLASAQSAGTWSARVGVTNLSPDVSSGNLSAPSFPNTKVDAKGNTQLSGGINYMLTDNLALDLPLATCPDSCDHIPRRSWALFQAREIMRSVLESFKREPST